MRIDSPAFEFLTDIANMVIVNILFLVCSIPVVTIGASYAALHKVMQELSFGNEKSSVFKAYFQAFKENWKQGSKIEIAVVLVIAGVFCNELLIQVAFGKKGIEILNTIIFIFTMYFSGLLGILVSFVVRYQNTMLEHLHNALYFTIKKPFRTIVMSVCVGAPAFLCLYHFDLFLRTIMFWTFFGVAGLSWLENKIVYPVFMETEEERIQSITR